MLFGIAFAITNSMIYLLS